MVENSILEFSTGKLGKGKVVYVNGAIERDSFLQGGAYSGKDLNPLCLVYRTAARLAGVRRVARTGQFLV